MKERNCQKKNGNERKNERSERQENKKNEKNAYAHAMSDDVSHATKNSTSISNADGQLSAQSQQAKLNAHTPTDMEDIEKVFENATENKAQDDYDDSIKVTDEYVEPKTPGAKLLEALTPKPRHRRRKQ